MSHIELTTVIAAPPEVCFDLVLNVDTQLALGDDMRAVAGVATGPLHRGDTVTWRARQFGVLWRMTSEITLVERPHRFVDEMQSGPFARWRHTHRFEPISEGTAMRDSVDYAPPIGILGKIFDAAILQRHLTALLMDRNRRLTRLAERSPRSDSSNL